MCIERIRWMSFCTDSFFILSLVRENALTSTGHPSGIFRRSVISVITSALRRSTIRCSRMRRTGDAQVVPSDRFESAWWTNYVHQQANRRREEPGEIQREGKQTRERKYVFVLEEREKLFLEQFDSPLHDWPIGSYPGMHLQPPEGRVQLPSPLHRSLGGSTSTAFGTHCP